MCNTQTFFVIEPTQRGWRTSKKNGGTQILGAKSPWPLNLVRWRHLHVLIFLKSWKPQTPAALTACPGL